MSKASDILDNVSKVIVGKRNVSELVLTSIIADGHVLLEDVPGDGPVALGALLAGLGLLVGDGGGSVGRDALGLLNLGVVLVARNQSHYSAASSPSRMRGSTTA